jgi:DNA-binding winged helix-turn-helix (wHTH) protein
MHFGPFAFDAAARRLVCKGEDVHLTPKAFDLLGILIDAAPAVVAKEAIHAQLWPDYVVSDATLIGLIKEIRRALESEAPETQLIRTVHRVGYAFDGVAEPSTASYRVAGLLLLEARRFQLMERVNLIGRNADCDVWIDNATVSREHAQIVIESDRAILEDLGSKNGTRVNGAEVSGPRELNDGDDVQFGEVDAVYRSARSFQPTKTQVDV